MVVSNFKPNNANYFCVFFFFFFDTVVLLNANGKHFTAGIDLNFLASSGPKGSDVARKGFEATKFIKKLQESLSLNITHKNYI